MKSRFNLLQEWIAKLFPTANNNLSLLSGDASFRRYFRLLSENNVYVVMDAPPDKESCTEFVQVSTLLRQHNLNAAEIIVADLQQGFLLLTDFGDQQYFLMLQENTVNYLYKDALQALQQMQTTVSGDALPPYDAALLQREMQLFIDWLLVKHLDMPLDSGELAALQACFDQLCTSALAQPQVFVHRDYHSRNLMVVTDNNPGILDFQDAVQGAITYDLVSLLRDCYVAWPPAQIEAWALGYYEVIKTAGILPADTDVATFLRWFDWMGAQRHLKASGIFARLWHRDGKEGYLADIPRTLNYLVQETAPYPELQFLHDLVGERVLPALVEE